MPITAPPPLAELLGTSWRLEARANAIAWDGTAGSVWFGLDDGSLAIARSAWEGQPSVRSREGGGVELMPANGAAPSVARIPVHRGPCLALAADPDGGCLSGGADGELARVAADGTIDTLARFDGERAAPLAAGRGGWRVCAAGSVLFRFGAASSTLDLARPITALAVAPNGARVAIGQVDAITLWAGGDQPNRREVSGPQASLVWSPDSRRVVSASQAGDVLIWDIGRDGLRKLDDPAVPERRMAMLGDGRLALSAAGSVHCWDLETLSDEPCGPPNRDVVVQLAAHPRRALIAVGYGNGAVAICRPGDTEVVLVRGAGAGPVDALSWSPSGTVLAYAAGGAISVVMLPPALFRDGGRA